MSLSNPASLTLAMIRDLLAQGALSETDFAAFDRDPRAGVRCLVTTYRRQQTLKHKADAERSQLLAPEARARSDGFRVVCGVDEAGRGPLAGPVVAAAVVFTPGEYIAGVKDSKALNPARREELYGRILAQAVDWGVGSADHAEIDRVNILCATHLAMRRAIEGLRVAPPDLALVDGLPVKGLPCRHRAIVSGDATSFTIAAASILAKVTRDRLMAEYAQQYPVYGFIRNKGYGTPEHVEALRRFGPCPIHRRSFTLTGTSLFDFAF